MKNILKQIKSCFTDKDWDADATKVFGIAIITAGIVGFFLQKEDFQYLVGFGSTLVATGKFSKEG